MLIGVAREKGDDGGGGGDNGDDGTQSWELFVGMGDHDDTARYEWYNVCAALGVFIYSCLPNCLVVETMALLEPHEQQVAVVLKSVASAPSWSILDL